MAKTYEPIATTTLGTSTATVTFGSISGAYTDLVLVMQVLVLILLLLLLILILTQVANYSRTVLDGDGSSATSDRETSQTKMPELVLLMVVKALIQ
jgi:uncharacterized membrane protein